MSPREPVLTIRGLCVDYLTDAGGVHAVVNADLVLYRGELLGLAGESGSGKSTLAYAATRLLRAPGVITAGEVLLHSRPPAEGSPRSRGNVAGRPDSGLGEASRRFRGNAADGARDDAGSGSVAGNRGPAADRSRNGDAAGPAQVTDLLPASERKLREDGSRDAAHPAQVINLLAGDANDVRDDAGSGRAADNRRAAADHGACGDAAGPAQVVNLLAAGERELRGVRWSQIAVVMQSALSALNPVISVGAQLDDMLRVHRPELRRKARRERAAELLDMVGIPAGRLGSYPHELSGGMRQRAMIAMALALDPQVVIMDEPTTALDVVTQREILEELDRLRDRLGFATLFITHDLSLLAELADEIAVMYAGRLVERAPAAALLRAPRHPYTRGLLSSFPPMHGERRRMTGIPGSPPDLAAVPAGCAFAPRCSYAMPRCADSIPLLAPAAAALPDASLPAASLPAASLPAASLPAASLPAAPLPAAPLPAAPLPAAPLPAASLPSGPLSGASPEPGRSFLLEDPPWPESPRPEEASPSAVSLSPPPGSSPRPDRSHLPDDSPWPEASSPAGTPLSAVSLPPPPEASPWPDGPPPGASRPTVSLLPEMPLLAEAQHEVACWLHDGTAGVPAALARPEPAAAECGS